MQWLGQHLGNDEFVLAFTRYMGQSNHITRSMEGLHFGKKGEQVNAHATNLWVLHDQVKTIIITFLRLAGVEADEESALWMLGKVRDPFMKRYIDSLLRAQAADKRNPEGAIVADIVAWDLPTAKQASNDSGLGSRSDALGEVKTMQPGKSSYQKGHCQDNRPVDQRATQVRRNYKKRAGGLDRTHAPEVVGDGTNGQVRWVHSRRPLEHSTPATSSPLLSARSAKSMKTPASSLRILHASPPRLTLASRCRH